MKEISKELEKGDSILWDNELWEVINEHLLVRITDGCEYNTGVKLNDSKYYNQWNLILQLKN